MYNGQRCNGLVVLGCSVFKHEEKTSTTLDDI